MTTEAALEAATDAWHTPAVARARWRQLIMLGFIVFGLCRFGFQPRALPRDDAVQKGVASFIGYEVWFDSGEGP